MKNTAWGLLLASAATLLYVSYCAANMDAPWLMRGTTFPLYFTIPVATAAGALAVMDWRWQRAARIAFMILALLLLIFLVRFFAEAYGVARTY
ncbi:MAG: hypothetical protein ABI779_11285 [Acidobacteriota bacterium]